MTITIGIQLGQSLLNWAGRDEWYQKQEVRGSGLDFALRSAYIPPMARPLRIAYAGAVYHGSGGQVLTLHI